MQLTAEAAFKSGSQSLRQLEGLAGPYWQHFFQGQGDLFALLETVRQQNRQNLRQLSELVSLQDFNNAPIYKTETLFPVRVPVDKVSFRPLRYGGDAQYGPLSGTETYGQVFYDGWSMPLGRRDLSRATAVVNRPYRADYGEVIGVGAWIINNELELRDNPADVFQQIEYNDKPHYLVWLYMADFDAGYLTKQYGPLLGQSFRSQKPQQLAIKHAMSAIINGASEHSLRGVLAAAVGTEVAEQSETVEQVITDYGIDTVITDRRTLHAPDGSSAVVAKGDVLKSGDFFFDCCKFGNPGSFPDFLNDVTLTAGITKGDPITLAAGDLAATAETRDGELYIYPTASGDAPFWESVNASSPSLASAVFDHYGIIVANAGTASPSIVPSQIDFTSVLFEGIFGYKLSVSLLDSNQLVPGSIEILRLIRLVTPPWVGHLVEFTGQPPEGWLENAAECC